MVYFADQVRAGGISPSRCDLIDRIEELESVVGIGRTLTGRLVDAFGLEPMLADILGMLLRREFVTRDGLYTVLFGARPECEWPDEKVMDVQICKLRARLKARGHDITIVTRWGDGWSLAKADKARIRAIM